MITITGGAGFIGTSVCAHLTRDAQPFEIIDKVVSREFPSQTRLADLRNPHDLEAAIAPGTNILHLAAEHRDDVRPTSLYHDVNVQGAENLCASAEKKGVRKIVFTSTVAVYGFADPGTDESGPIRPFNEYGRSKAQAENVLRRWQSHDPNDRTLVIVRPTVVFGERNRGNVYNLIRQIHSGRFMMVGNGLNRKSMAYVENVSSFLIHCLQFPPGVHVYNYVDKPDFTMNELVSEVHRLLGRTSRHSIRLPYLLGLGIGHIFDAVAVASRRQFPISAIRVKKFCSNSVYGTSIAHSGFIPPVCLVDAFERTVRYEFLEKHGDSHAFYSE